MAEATTTIDLARFCAVDDERKPLNAPWRLNDHLYATNGHYAIEIADDGRALPEPCPEKYPNMAALFAKYAEHGAWLTFPRLQPREVCIVCRGKGVVRERKCDECDGQGKSHHGSHDYECRECDGEGAIVGSTGPKARCKACSGLGEPVFPHQDTRLPINSYATRYLRAISTLPGLRIAETVKDGALVFEFTGGRGLLMPVSRG